MDMSMQMRQEPETKPQIMQPPYTVDLSDSIADDESDAWTINNEEGSVAEMTCSAQDAEVTARFFVLAGNNHKALVAAVKLALAIENSVTLAQEKELRSQAKAMYEAALSAAQE